MKGLVHIATHYYKQAWMNACGNEMECYFSVVSSMQEWGYDFPYYAHDKMEKKQLLPTFSVLIFIAGCFSFYSSVAASRFEERSGVQFVIDLQASNLTLALHYLRTYCTIWRVQ